MSTPIESHFDTMAEARSAKRRRLANSSDPSDEEENTLRTGSAFGLQQRFAHWNNTLAMPSPEYSQVSANPSVLPTPRRSTSLEDANEHEGSLEQIKTKAVHKKLAYVQIPRPSLPNAAFYGWKAPDNTVSETLALADIVDKLPLSADGSRYIELDDFTIHRPNSDDKRSMEMCTLDRLQVDSAPKTDELCFSGHLSIGRAKAQHYAHNVRFRVITIDGYGNLDCASVHDKICIQSSMAQSHDVWYRLRRPSNEYKGFYDPFLWVAAFTKYFVDYLLDEPSVTLRHFQSAFAVWLRTTYSQFAYFHSWHEQCGFKEDFRTSVAAYMPFLHKECHSLDVGDPSTKLLRHAIWSEALPWNLGAIPEYPSNKEAPTVVTPFVHRCFNGMYFAKHLSMETPNMNVIAKIVQRKREMCLTPWDPAPTQKPQTPVLKQKLTVCRGDVVSINPDTRKKSAWKKSTSVLWYAYVQGIRHTRKGGQVLDVLWLYEPADTTLGTAHYPFQNELFFSDICNCGDDAIPVEDVVAKLNMVCFVVDPQSVQKRFFVRQIFHTKEEEGHYSFSALSSEHFHCDHTNPSKPDHPLDYRVGDTVLVRPQNASDMIALLEPARVIRCDPDDEKFVLRKMLRSVDLNPKAYPNELEEGYEEWTVKPSQIVRRCKVAQFASRRGIVTPYNRRGAGDYFFVLEQSDMHNPEGSLRTPPASEDATEPETTPPLIGLSLYSGGGNFDRGLEEAGAVKTKHAVDWDTAALHSYMANVDNPDSVHYFLGSVNDFILQAMRDSKSVKIALPGGIQILFAGSPCPGFSTMQVDKQSESSLRFASMVASVVAFVDFYNPEYLILENVVTMSNNITINGEDQNVFSQILAALVALGYQVQQFLVDAWTVGSSQQRSRVFIVASAPGTVPLPIPPMTHAHPPGFFKKRGLGKTINGLSIGQRRDDFTPFRHVSAHESCRDLPEIGDSLTQICPIYPDHRVYPEENQAVRELIAQVPLHPQGMGLCQAVASGRITSGNAYEWVQKNNGNMRAGPNSRSLTRIRPDGLIPTILTKLSIQCGKNGSFVHWNQHRPISNMEARRAQGFLDHEVIVGAPVEQMRIVGNSVDRKVAFAMGLAIKESRDATLKATRQLLEADDPKDLGHIEDSRLQPSPTQIRAIQRELIQERSEVLATIIQTLRNKKQAQGKESSPPPPAEWADEDIDVDASLRWAGDSPADALAVRRRATELETVIHPSH